MVKAIVSEKNYKQAAEALYISQPSLTKQIKLLEERLGVILFDRTNKKVVLTEAGKLFLYYTERILVNIEESEKCIADYKLGIRGSISIGASKTIGTYLIPQIITLFIQNHPQIAINTYVDSTRKIGTMVKNRIIDIALVGGRIPDKWKKDGALEIKAITNDEFCLISAPDHPFSRKIINKDDLYQLDFLTLKDNSPTQKFIEKVLSSHNITPTKLNITLKLNSIEAIKTAVGVGSGVAFVSYSAIKNELKSKTLNIISVENIKIMRKISIITSSNCYRSMAFDLFYSELLLLENTTSS